ncbi:flagellar biosynthesis anti-sigma factor FlgM [uncultured Sphingomonas sp.]|uniref:flagellar biosynthesis anti-sigma factor FlgM n=1 Tax=uncultured Sphingomonas sp. TaxID=158754 RepID=UPI0026374142|nr:flagellar biosynthesis anti-sigma factor FlgM [uncultured Sphingomonas sp.]
MVDSIGARPATTSDLPVAPVARVLGTQAVPPISARSETAVNANAQPQTLASRLAAKPPVDSDRVQRIKNALANGTFPISPATLADQLIALRYDWLSDDKA